MIILDYVLGLKKQFNPDSALGLVMKIKKAIKSRVLARFYDVGIAMLFQRIKSRRRLSLQHFLFVIEF